MLNQDHIENEKWLQQVYVASSYYKFNVSMFVLLFHVILRRDTTI